LSKTNEQNKPEQNQTDELKQLFEEIEMGQSNPFNEYKNDEPQIDVLDLPPRKEVHNQEQRLVRIPLNKSLVRFIVVILIIAVILYLLLTNDHFNLI